MSTSSNGEDATKCVFNGFGGQSHPYSECIASIDETMPNTKSCDPWGLICVEQNVGALFAYANSLLINSGAALSSSCNNVLGSKYVLETGTNCTLPNGNVVPRHKYINSVESGTIGILPAALNSATNINGMEMISSFTKN